METTDLKYNYVIIGSDGFYDVAYNDVKTLPNVVYHSNYLSGIDNILYNTAGN